MDLPQAKAILKEKQKRLQRKKRLKKASASLIEFIRVMMPSYIVNWHHEAICERLTRLKDEEGKRIMIFVGPQRGKTEIVSRMFPAWWLGHFPGSKNILSSYSGDLANSFNKDTQNIMAEPAYKEIFPDTLTAHDEPKLKMTQNEFHTSKGGVMFSVGVGGSTTGRSAGAMGNDTDTDQVQKGCFIVDDPIKDHADARSPAGKLKRELWWAGVMNTRIHRTSHVILMHTRWAVDDLAGNIIADGALEKGWEIISFPELGPDPEYPNAWDKRTDPEDPLWPEEKGDLDEINKVRENVGEFTFSALYQQKPTVPGGNIIKQEWINLYTRLPFDPAKLKSSDMLQSWDLTFKETTKGSFVVGVTIARYNADFYILDIYRKRAGFNESRKAVVTMSDSFTNNKQVLIEEKANGSAIIDSLKKIVSGLIPVKPDATKEERLHVVAPIFEAGNFYMPANHVHTKACIAELISFPNSANDDFVDAISQGLTRFGKLRGLARLQASVQ